MLTYILLNIIVIVIVAAALRPVNIWGNRPALITLVILLLLTAIFDNLIVAASIVGYDSAKILGVYIGVAPVEDFMYAVLSVIAVVAIWNKLGETHAKHY